MIYRFVYRLILCLICLSVLSCTGCTAEAPAEGTESLSEPETIAVSEPVSSPETTAESTEPAEQTAMTTPLSTLRVQALTGYPITAIHEQLPNYHQLPEYIAWDGVIYTRLGMYISDVEGEELEPKGSYTWWSYENWSGQLTSHEQLIRLYSVGELPSSACVATNFDIFASGSRTVYVNEAEWTEEMTESLSAYALE